MEDNQKMNASILTESQHYSVNEQECHNWGMAGDHYDDAIFIDRETGKEHMRMSMIVIHKDIQWSSDGNRLFFNGYDPDPYMLRDDDPYFLVIDVKNKEYLHVYQGHALNPHWNEDESDALFDNELNPNPEIFSIIDRETKRRAFHGNHPVIHYENGCGFMVDGKLYLAQSFSPTRKFLIRFYKLTDTPDDNFHVSFSLFVQNEGQWKHIEKWKPTLYMVNGVDGFVWFDENTILYTGEGNSRVMFEYVEASSRRLALM